MIPVTPKNACVSCKLVGWVRIILDKPQYEVKGEADLKLTSIVSAVSLDLS